MQEPLRIWGEIKDGVIVKASEPKITCPACIRVPGYLTEHRHSAAGIRKNSAKKPTKEELIDRLVKYSGLPQEVKSSRVHRNSSFST